MTGKLELLTVLLLALAIGSNAQCDQTLDDFDKCAQIVNTFGNRQAKIPTNEAELNQHCNATKGAFSCMGKYVKKCMSPFAQTLFGVMQYDAKKAYNTHCVEPAGRKEFLKHMKCGIPQENFEPLHMCVDNYVAQINWLINKNLGKEDQLGGMCCSVVQLHKCFISRSGEACDKVTGPETKEYFDRSMTAAVSEGMDYTCGNFRNMDMCNSNLKKDIWEPLFKIGQDAKKEHKESKYHSPITVMMMMFSKMN